MTQLGENLCSLALVLHVLHK